LKKSVWVIAIIVLASAAIAYVPLANLAFAVRLAWIARSLAQGSPGDDLHIQQTKVQRRMGTLDVDALTYRTGGSEPKRALVLVAGISELGCYHPQLTALSRQLAERGFLVVTPDIPVFRRLQISAEPIDQIAFWYRQVPTLEGGRQVGQIGLAGISFSATLSLIAAARPEIRNDVAFCLGIGPYYDLQRCFQGWFASGPVTMGEGYYPTRFYAKWLVMKAALNMLSAARDRQFLRNVLLDLLLQKQVPPADPDLTPEGLRWYRLAIMREDQSDEELSRAIYDYLAPILFRQLQPTKAAVEVRCPVFLLHGAYDDLIPPEESREMQQHIIGAPCYLLVSPFLTHTQPFNRPFTWSKKVEALKDSLAFFYRFARTVS
jgi:pimeloyl-ACP methyl ester carboxylesterase